MELIKSDCTYLFNCYGVNPQCFETVLEYFEHFIIREINTLFEECNSFDEIVLTHQINLVAFVQYVEKNIDLCEMPTPAKRVKLTKDLFVIYITVQEWLLRGAKGQQFYSMVNVDAFNFCRKYVPPVTKTAAQTVFRFQPKTRADMPNEKSYLVSSFLNS